MACLQGRLTALSDLSCVTLRRGACAWPSLPCLFAVVLLRPLGRSAGAGAWMCSHPVTHASGSGNCPRSMEVGITDCSTKGQGGGVSGLLQSVETAREGFANARSAARVAAMSSGDACCCGRYHASWARSVTSSGSASTKLPRELAAAGATARGADWRPCRVAVDIPSCLLRGACYTLLEGRMRGPCRGKFYLIWWRGWFW